MAGTVVGKNVQIDSHPSKHSAKSLLPVFYRWLRIFEVKLLVESHSEWENQFKPYYILALFSFLQELVSAFKGSLYTINQALKILKKIP